MAEEDGFVLSEFDFLILPVRKKISMDYGSVI